jgi:hypothetical protein
MIIGVPSTNQIFGVPYEFFFEIQNRGVFPVAIYLPGIQAENKFVLDNDERNNYFKGYLPLVTMQHEFNNERIDYVVLNTCQSIRTLYSINPMQLSLLSGKVWFRVTYNGRKGSATLKKSLRKYYGSVLGNEGLVIESAKVNIEAGETCINHWIKILKFGDNSRERASAAFYLAILTRKEAVKELMDAMLSDKELEVRIYAAAALNKIMLRKEFDLPRFEGKKEDVEGMQREWLNKKCEEIKAKTNEFLRKDLK